MTHALIIATGPSLTLEDVDEAWCLRRRTYVVNDAYRIVPYADVLYACDEQWWNIHEPKTRNVPERWTTNDQASEKYGLHHIPGRFGNSTNGYFDTTGDGIIYGSNSGFQALNLAYAQGARDAVLLGFDMGQARDGPGHFFGEHPAACNNPRPYKLWLDQWVKAAPVIAAAGMRVVNATRGGYLEVFPRVALGDLCR